MTIYIEHSLSLFSSKAVVGQWLHALVDLSDASWISVKSTPEHSAVYILPARDEFIEQDWTDYTVYWIFDSDVNFSFCHTLQLKHSILSPWLPEEFAQLFKIHVGQELRKKWIWLPPLLITDKSKKSDKTIVYCGESSVNQNDENDNLCSKSITKSGAEIIAQYLCKDNDNVDYHEPWSDSSRAPKSVMTHTQLCHQLEWQHRLQGNQSFCFGSRPGSLLRYSSIGVSLNHNEIDEEASLRENYYKLERALKSKRRIEQVSITYNLPDFIAWFIDALDGKEFIDNISITESNCVVFILMFPGLREAKPPTYGCNNAWASTYKAHPKASFHQWLSNIRNFALYHSIMYQLNDYQAHPNCQAMLKHLMRDYLEWLFLFPVPISWGEHYYELAQAIPITESIAFDVIENLYRNDSEYVDGYYRIAYSQWVHSSNNTTNTKQERALRFQQLISKDIASGKASYNSRWFYRIPQLYLNKREEVFAYTAEVRRENPNEANVFFDMASELLSVDTDANVQAWLNLDASPLGYSGVVELLSRLCMNRQWKLAESMVQSIYERYEKFMGLNTVLSRRRILLYIWARFENPNDINYQKAIQDAIRLAELDVAQGRDTFLTKSELMLNTLLSGDRSVLKAYVDHVKNDETARAQAAYFMFLLDEWNAVDELINDMDFNAINGCYQKFIYIFLSFIRGKPEALILECYERFFMDAPYFFEWRVPPIFVNPYLLQSLIFRCMGQDDLSTKFIRKAEMKDNACHEQKFVLEKRLPSLTVSNNLTGRLIHFCD